MSPASRALGAVSAGFTASLRFLILTLAAVAGLGVMTMMAVTTADVIMRAFGRPLKGALDIVSIAGAITISAALPYTTAVKGHVAIEYFFLKLSRRGRIVVDTFARMLAMTVFAVLAWQSYRYGVRLGESGRVTDTIMIPLFWVPWVIATACAVVMLVTLHNMLHPGRETIKP